METKCVCFFDKDGSITKDMKLTAGDDATDCHWMTADLDDPGFKLYASHRDFLKLAIDKVKSEMKKTDGTRRWVNVCTRRFGTTRVLMVR